MLENLYEKCHANFKNIAFYDNDERCKEGEKDSKIFHKNMQ